MCEQFIGATAASFQVHMHSAHGPVLREGTRARKPSCHGALLPYNRSNLGPMATALLMTAGQKDAESGSLAAGGEVAPPGNRYEV